MGTTIFLTYKMDQRNVPDLYILQSYDDEHLESIRPRLLTYKCSFPEDKDVPYAHYYIGDVQKGTMQKVDLEPQIAGGRLFSSYYAQAKWTEDSTAVYTTLVRRGHKSADFVIIYPDGNTKTVLTETSDTALNICSWGNLDGYNDYCASNFLTKDQKTVIWQSERDNFARLFRYDAETGALLQALTPDNVSVGELIYNDDDHQVVAAGVVRDDDGLGDRGTALRHDLPGAPDESEAAHGTAWLHRDGPIVHQHRMAPGGVSLVGEGIVIAYGPSDDQFAALIDYVNKNYDLSA